jgi:hypothetical protein
MSSVSPKMFQLPPQAGAGDASLLGCAGACCSPERRGSLEPVEPFALSGPLPNRLQPAGAAGAGDLTEAPGAGGVCHLGVRHRGQTRVVKGGQRAVEAADKQARRGPLTSSRGRAHQEPPPPSAPRALASAGDGAAGFLTSSRRTVVNTCVST